MRKRSLPTEDSSNLIGVPQLLLVYPCHRFRSAAATPASCAIDRRLSRALDDAWRPEEEDSPRKRRTVDGVLKSARAPQALEEE